VTRKFLILFLILCVQKLYGQTLPTDSEINELIKAKVKDTTLPLLFKPIISKTVVKWPEQFLIYGENGQTNPFSIYKKRESVFLDTILTSEDRNYIKLQADSFRQKTLTITDIKYASSLDSVKTYLSLPLFSRNKEFAIIRQLTRCGPNCGSMDILLYRKIHGVWHYYKYIMGGLL